MKINQNIEFSFFAGLLFALSYLFTDSFLKNSKDFMV